MGVHERDLEVGSVGAEEARARLTTFVGAHSDDELERFRNQGVRFGHEFARWVRQLRPYLDCDEFEISGNHNNFTLIRYQDEELLYRLILPNVHDCHRNNGAVVEDVKGNVRDMSRPELGVRALQQVGEDILEHLPEVLSPEMF